LDLEEISSEYENYIVLVQVNGQQCKSIRMSVSFWISYVGIIVSWQWRNKNNHNCFCIIYCILQHVSAFSKSYHQAM